MMSCRRPVFLLITGLWAVTQCRALQYHFISAGLPWFKAQLFCREQYADLASVFSIEDMNRLVNTAQDSNGGFTEKAWIGLYDNFTSWRWSSSDSRYYGDKESNYRNWGISQPDNFAGDQMCVKTWGGGTWEDAQCSLRYPFICYDGSNSTSQSFVFVEQEMSWSDAQLYCRTSYTDLASVRDEKENEEIQHLSNGKGVWIGLYRRREWSDRSASSYRYWKAGEPNNFKGDENCTAADLGYAGLWSDEDCNQELAFVCYEKSDSPDLSTTTATTAATTSTSTTSSTEGTTTEKTTSLPAPHTSDSAITTTTTVSPNERATTQTTTHHISFSTAAGTPNKVTAERGSSSPAPASSEFLSTPDTDQTAPTTDEKTAVNPNTERHTDVPTTTGRTEVTSPVSEHLIHMRATFTCTIPLSQDDLKELVSVKFYKLLIEKGLPASIKVGLRTPQK